MSKTSASLHLETNQKRGLAQENAFLHNFYRIPSDFNASYRRSATSTAPIQIVALASAQGDDTIAAMALQSVMKIVERSTAEAQTHSVIDFPNFSTKLIDDLNTMICNYSIKNNGSPIRVSLTALVFEGDTLRVISVGNTRAVLIRDRKVIPLTEDQTVAHRYVQMGAITPEMEKTHPERTVLTQYIGRFQQDGPVHAEKKVYFKLKRGDEIALMGTGISEAVSIADRDAVLSSINNPEFKTAELIRLAQMMTKGGLSALVIRVDETVIMPAAGAMMSAAGSASLQAATSQAYSPAVQGEQQGDALQANSPDDETTEEQTDMVGYGSRKKPSKAKAVFVPIGIFVAALLIGYLGLMLLFRVGNFLPATATPTEAGVEASLGRIKYITSDLVALYPEASLETTPTKSLSRGEVVTYFEDSGSFSRVKTTDGTEGYVLAVMLSDQDPTIGDSLPEMSADPTPIPSQEQTAITIAPVETTVTESTSTSSQTSASSDTSASSEETTASTSATESTTTASESTTSTSATESTTSSTTQATTESTTSATTTETTAATSAA